MQTTEYLNTACDDVTWDDMTWVVGPVELWQVIVDLRTGVAYTLFSGQGDDIPNYMLIQLIDEGYLP